MGQFEPLSRSSHVTTRIQQRGLRGDDLDLILDYAERSVPAGAGCETCSIGRQGFQNMLLDGVSPQRADHLKRFAVVISYENNIVVTVYPPLRNKRRSEGQRSDRRGRNVSHYYVSR